VAGAQGKPYETTAHRRAFGDQVRALRREREWTQEQLAEAAAMDRSYLAGVETGSRNATLDIIDRLARALGVRIAELFPDQ
jgi:transcriptional regulator with XRE-family HTH domain